MNKSVIKHNKLQICVNDTKHSDNNIQNYKNKYKNNKFLLQQYKKELNKIN